MAIEYSIGERVTAKAFTAVLQASGLAERRPVDDPECIQGMLAEEQKRLEECAEAYA